MIYIYLLDDPSYFHLFLFEILGKSDLERTSQEYKVRYYVAYNSANKEYVKREGSIGPGTLVYDLKKKLNSTLSQKAIRAIFNRIPWMEGITSGSKQR